MKYEIVIDGKAATLATAEGRFAYGALERDYSAAAVGEGAWSILIEGRSYAVQVLGAGEVSVNGRVYHVEVIDPRGPRGRRSAGESSGPRSITAAMPGRVVRVLAAVGDDVAEGAGVVVIEAMKMQNELKSPKAGRVSRVAIAVGDAVGAGDVLVVVE